MKRSCLVLILGTFLASGSLHAEPPVFISVSPADGTLTGATAVTLSGELTGAASLRVDGVAVDLSGESWSTGPLSLSEGENVFLLEADDGSGTITTRNHRVVRDTLAPTIAVDQPATAVVGATPTLVSGTIGDAHPDEVSIDGVAASLMGSAFSRSVGLVEGPQSLTLVARDAVGHETTRELALTLDTVAPSVTITEGGSALADGALFNRAVTPGVAVSDATAVEVVIELDGASFASGATVSAEGAHTLSVTATDAAGHAASLSRAFTIDLTPPAIVSISPADGTLTAEAQVTLSGQVTGATAVTLDGAAASLSGESWSAGPFALGEGERAWSVVVSDAAGNGAERQHRIERDATAPVITVSSPADGAVVGSSPVEITGTASDPHLLEVRVAGALASLAGEGFTASQVALVEGANTVSITAGDSVGNGSQVELSLTLDTVAPQVSVEVAGAPLADGAVFNGPLTPTITASDATTVTLDVLLDGAAYTPGTAISTEGEHQLSVTATDAAGNDVSLPLSFTIDASPPVLGAITPAAGAVLSAAEVSLSGTVEGAASVTVDGQAASLAGGSWSAGPFALEEGERVFTVTAVDAGGNRAEVTHRVVRDASAPVVSVSSPPAGWVTGQARVDVAGTAEDPHLSRVTVGGIVASLAGSSFLARDVALAEGVNTLTVRAEDAAGHFTELGHAVEHDGTAPRVAITDPAPGTVTPEAVITLSGTASDAHLDRVEVGGTRAALAGGTWSLEVSLAEGANDLTATAWDRHGHSAQASVTVLRDSSAHEVHVETPAEGLHTRAAEVAVSGTVEEAAGTTVTVNGLEAVVTAGSFSVASVPLLEGENPLVARATDAQGNQGKHTRLVVRDTVAPELVSSQPASGALAIAATTSFRLSFSEALAELAAGAWRLETATGATLPASAVVDGVELRVTPAAPLPSQAEVRLVLTAALEDLAGNGLATPRTLSFTTVDTAAPAAPILDPVAPIVCQPRLGLSGSAEANARVRAEGGQAGAETRAAADGSFSLSVPLLGETLNPLRLTAIDPEGNVSPEVALDVVHDCTPPQVVASQLAGDAVTLSFSEAIDGSSLAGQIQLSSAAGPLAGTVSGNGSQATFTASAPLPAESLLLEVGTGVLDLGGNGLAFPYSRVFLDAIADSFFAGTVIDAATGRPLAGARVVVTASGGTAPPSPAPEQTTAADGRFLIPVAPGTHDVTVVRPGYVPAFRIVTTEAGRGSDVFDPRLEPAAEAETVGAGGATVVSGGAQLEVPAGALTGAEAVALTPLGEQSLPALLPYGWSPRGGAWIDAPSSGFQAPAILQLPVEAPEGTLLAVASLDLATLQWTVEDVAAVSGGRLEAEVTGLGAIAAVEADGGPLAPPPPVVGQVLGSSTPPAGDEVTAAEIAFDPATVLPTQSSTATVTYTLAAEAPSGLPLTLRVEEELALADGSTRRVGPYRADLLLYRAGDGTPRSRFELRPSDDARVLQVNAGAEVVTVLTYGDEGVRGDVLGPEGGSVVSAEGDQVTVPAVAVSAPTAVALERRAATDLPLEAPAAGALEGVLELDLGGVVLGAPARLELHLGSAPDDLYGGLLLHVVEHGGAPRYRVVAELEATPAGWATKAIDALDLPWPGVREGGLYLFLRLTEAHGFVRGTVRRVDGTALAGAPVESDVAEWLQLSGSDGRYALPLPLTPATITASDAASGNAVSVASTLTSGGERLDLDLQLQVVPPWVVELTPADGSTGVPTGIEPAVRFSEPVDRASLEGGLRLLHGSQEVAVTLDHQGALVRLLPDAPLEGQESYTFQVSTEVRDLQGHALASARVATFTTREVAVPAGVDRSRIHPYAPDAGGLARVEGLSGAVPGGSTVWLENLTSSAAVPTVEAAVNGSFEMELAAALSDRLVLNVLVEGGNQLLIELTPFLSADLRGAWIGPRGAELTTPEGLTVAVEPGTFLVPTWVRAETRSLTEPPHSVPEGLEAMVAFRLDFGGATALKPVQLRVPAPAGAPAGGSYLLNRSVEVLGGAYWMLHDLLTLEAGYFTTPLPEPQSALLAGPQAKSAPLTTRFAPPHYLRALSLEEAQALQDASGPVRPLRALPSHPTSAVGESEAAVESEARRPEKRAVESGGHRSEKRAVESEGRRPEHGAQPNPEGAKRLSTARRATALAAPSEEGPRGREAERQHPPSTKSFTGPRDYLTGAAFAGDYQVVRAQEPTGYVAVPLVGPGDLAAFNFAYGAQTPMVAIADPSTRPRLPSQHLLLPTPLGRDLDLELQDLSTGYTLFRDLLPPPASPGTVIPLPPDGFGDGEGPVPLGGAPLAFHLLLTERPGTVSLGPGLSAELDGTTLRVLGAAGSLGAGLEARLFGLESGGLQVASGGADGAFSLERAVSPGERFVLALGVRLLPITWIELRFSEALAEGHPGLEVLDDRGRRIEVEVLPAGAPGHLRLRPRTGWVAGAYRLRFTEELRDTAGQSFPGPLEVPFEVVAGQVVDTLELPDVQDLARLGDLVLVAAQSEGLRIVDASDPRHLRGYLPGELGVPFPQGEPVRGVAADPHGRVLVAGGGAGSFGQLKVLDLEALDLAAIAADPGDASLRLGAWKGSTLLCDPPGGVETHLPNGVPRRVAVLSADDRDRWRVGEVAPAGLALEPPAPPAGGGSYTLTVSGTGSAERVATLRNLRRGSWRRADTDGAGGFSVSLEVTVGDELELLRNRESFAYVAIDGVGIAVVDVSGFYGEDLSEPLAASQVLRFHGGFPVPTGEVCDVTSPQVVSIPRDLEVLLGADALEPHPLTLPTLIPGYGLGILEAPLADPAALVPLAGQCGAVEGRAALSAMAVLDRYAFDLDGDGEAEPSEVGDYVVLTHGEGWLLTVDVSDRSAPELVGKVRLPGAAAGVTVDRALRRAYVAGFGAGVYVVDLDAAPSLQVPPGEDPRLLERIEIPGEDVREVLMASEVGLAYAGGPGRGLSGLATAPPRLDVVAEEAGSLRRISRVAPFGVPTGPEAPADPGSPDQPGAVRVELRLPGALGDAVELDVLSLGPGGEEVQGAGALPGLPPTGLRGSEALELRRQASHPWEEGYSLYRSEPIVLLADLMASAHYPRSALEDDRCERCDLVEEGVYASAAQQAASPHRELLSGHRLAVRFSSDLRVALAELYGGFLLDEAELELESVPWDVSPSPRQEPALNPSYGTGDAVPGTLLHSGEMSLSEADLALRVPGMPLVFERTYRSQTLGDGPLGPGWDHGYRLRLRALPNGDVDFFDGRGRRERFRKVGTGKLRAPAGRFAALERTAGGWAMVDAAGEVSRFDSHGRLVSTSDVLNDRAESGSRLRFAYDEHSRLVEVRSHERSLSLDYDAEGRIEKVSDDTGREYIYSYDGEGRLVAVTTPPITVGLSTFPQGLTTVYGYEDPEGGLDTALHRRDNLTSVTDAEGETWFGVSYLSESGVPGDRHSLVYEQDWGGHESLFAFTFSDRSTEVRDRRGKYRKYWHTAEGHLKRSKDPAGYETVWTYGAYAAHPEVGEPGLPSEVLLADGRKVTTTYEQAERPAGVEILARRMANVTSVTVEPIPGGDPNGSAAALVTRYAGHHSQTNVPQSVTDPAGHTVEMLHQPSGLVAGAELEVPALRPELQDQTLVLDLQRDDLGQVARSVDPGGRVVEHEYHTEGRKKGYPKRSTVDPDGLALTSFYEVDDRGQVTAIQDPRGVTHEFSYNELGWLVEERWATAAAGDLEPIGHTLRYLHDANGRLVEVQQGYGEIGASLFSRARLEYDVLGRPVKVSREVTPGQGDWLEEIRSYDPGGNLEEVIAHDGGTTRLEYDDRGLLARRVEGVGSPIEREESFRYDAAGRPTEHVDVRGGRWLAAYDGYGRSMVETDPAGTKVSTTYDDLSRPARVEVVDADDDLLERTFMDIDAAGRPVVEARWLPPSDPLDPQDPGSLLTSVTRFDESSQVVETIDPRGISTLYTYDAAQRLVRRQDEYGIAIDYELDAGGNVVRTTEHRPAASPSLPFVTEASYDALGRVIQVTDAFGNTTDLQRDVRGNVLREIDALDQLTSRAYDGLDRLTSVQLPKGITEGFAYADALNEVTYTDARGLSTRSSFDLFGRMREVHYADGTQESTRYDPGGQLAEVVRADGTRVLQTFDSLGRIETRQVELPDGSQGPGASYDFDGLSRLTRAFSSGVLTELEYDMASRLVRETTAGQSSTYGYDAADNPISMESPSGLVVERVYSTRNRLLGVSRSVGGGAPAGRVSYSYRGLGTVSERDLMAGGIGGEILHDSARRPVQTSYRRGGSGGSLIFGESLRWSPRNLLLTQARDDLNGAGTTFTYDAARRLESAERTVGLDGTTPFGRAFTESAQSFAYEYDEAQNLTWMSESLLCDASGVSLPPEPQRNRPDQVGEVEIDFDQRGNLVRKGDWEYEYDHRDRLIRVEKAGAEVASYGYDDFDRRISRTVAGETFRTVWDGWQSIEGYLVEETAGAPILHLVSRRIYGLGIDEIVSLELDPDGDGNLTEYLPFYDQTGNLVLLSDAQGRPVERYEYSPYGERWIWVDSTSPWVEQLRAGGDRMILELSEPIQLDAFEKAVAAGTVSLSNATTGEAIGFTVQWPVTQGRQALRRLVLIDAEPSGDSDWPMAANGEQLELRIAATALRDFFDNQAAADFQRTIPWTDALALVLDTAPPSLVQACVLGDQHLELVFSERLDAGRLASEIQLDGAAIAWQEQADGYTLRSATSIATGTHTLSLGTGALDLDGKGLAQSFSETFSVEDGSPAQTLHSAPFPGQVAASTVGNPYGFQGLPHDPETGLIYVRHRYYDPELGRFLTADPMGRTDGPSLYQFALNNPANYGDPTGEVAFIPLLAFGAKAALIGTGAYFVGDQAIDRFHQLVDQDPHASLASTGAAAFGLGLADTVGLTSVAESATGIEVLTGRKLSGRQRLRRGGMGVAQAAMTVAGVRFSLSRGLRGGPSGNLDEAAASAAKKANFENYGLELVDDAPWSVPRGTTRFIARERGEILDTSRIVIPGPRNSAFGKVDFLLGRILGSAKSVGRGGTFARTLGFTDSSLEVSLRKHLTENFGVVVIQGNRITVTAPLRGPSGATRGVRSVWQVLDDGSVELITAFERKVGR